MIQRHTTPFVPYEVAHGTKPADPVVDKPDDTWRKADIQKWLTDHSIDYPALATKADLLVLVEN